MTDKFTEVIFPKSRVATLDMGDLKDFRNHVMGFLELDVTDARQKIRELRRSSDRQLSLTAWLIKAICAAIEEFPVAAGYLSGKSKALVFETVDIAMLVERDVDGYKVPLPYVLREANRKDMFTITEEIESAKNTPLDGGAVINDRWSRIGTSIYYALPGFLRRAIWKIYFLRPKVSKQTMGNVSFTSIGMMGNQSGWFISGSIHPLAFGVGSVVRKPGVVGNKIEIREYLNLSIGLDHDVIDGADMARFINTLARKIEKGAGLMDSENFNG
jgi:pyruvate/2-oxoglutarate dehydrogenase complex dihydrolipoamide acyltransferase (E2) component